MSGRILFFDVANPGFAPLVERLFDRGFDCLLSVPTLLERLRAGGRACGDWTQASGAATEERIRAGLVAVLGRVKDCIGQDAADRALGGGRGGFLRRHGAGFLRDLQTLLAGQIQVVEVMADLQRRARPDLVVLGGDNSHRQRAMIAACRKAGIPTLNLSHATFAQAVQGRYPANQTHLYADRVATYGLRSKRDMIALGYPAERIETPGGPLWDPLYRLRGRHDPAAARRRFRGDEDPRPVLLFCACYAEATSCFYPRLLNRSIDIYRSLARSFRNFGSGLRVIVRPHPIEFARDLHPEGADRRRIELFRATLARLGLPQVEVSRAPIEEDVLGADLVVSTNGSSTIPLAMILERPVLSYRWYESEDRTYTEDDGVFLAERDCDLGFMAEELLRSPALRLDCLERADAALPAINSGHDGRATERLAALIAELGRADPVGITTASPSCERAAR